MLAAIEQAVAAGVPVVWMGELPSRAIGLADAEVRDADVNARIESLRGAVTFVGSAEQIPAAISNAGSHTSVEPSRRGRNADLRTASARHQW